jgi:tetratricopeptide (TPR) repeat protein
MDGKTKCQGITDKNARCSRLVPKGDKYCWQHSEQSRNYSSDEEEMHTDGVGNRPHIDESLSPTDLPSEGDQSPSATLGNVSPRKALPFKLSKVVQRFPTRLKQLTIGGVITFIVAMIGLSADLVGLDIVSRPEPQVTMSGDFRIAIAGFSQSGNTLPPEIGKELAEGMFLRTTQVIKELNLKPIVIVWGPNQVGTVKGATTLQRTTNASDIAAAIEADIVIYGHIEAEGREWKLTPEFYISERDLSTSSELIGQHELGSPFTVVGTAGIATRTEISEQLTVRAEILSHVVVGLAYYTVKDYAEAQRNFELAETSDAWEQVKGKHVLYLLLGNTATRLEQLDLAEQHYLAALTIDDEYSRAYSGLAGIYYLRSLEQAEMEQDLSLIDEELLELAIQTYETAREARNQPASSNVMSRIHFGLGQCYLLQSVLSDTISVEPAINEFKEVIRLFEEEGEVATRELAAEAHARLGLIYFEAGLDDRAVTEYETAVSLLFDDPERRAIYEERVQQLKNR